MKSVFANLLVLVCIFGFIGSSSGQQTSLPSPGSFSVVLIGQLPSGERVVRLTMYSFQTGGCTVPNTACDMRQDFWAWTANRKYQYTNSPVRIGSITSGEPTRVKDQNRFIRYLANYLADGSGNIDQPTTGFGKWTREKDKITITWGGGVEEWLIRSEQQNLSRISLLSSTDVVGKTYADITDTADLAAVNAGWGFGGPGFGFGQAETNLDSMYGRHFGKYLQWDGASGANGGVVVGAEWTFQNTVFRTSDTGVSKAYIPRTLASCPAGDQRTECYDKYFYFGLLGARATGGGTTDPERLARRVLYHNSHDFDAKGYIEGGHIKVGLQIIDAAGRYQGIVLAEITANDGKPNTLAAMFFLRRQP